MSADQQQSLSHPVPRPVANTAPDAPAEREPERDAEPGAPGVAAPQPATEYLHVRLLEQARRAAGTLARQGVGPAERVAVLLPMSPESVAVTMACGRLDAVRVSLPVGAGAPLLRERIRSSGAGVLVVADSCVHAGRIYPAKQLVERVLDGCPAVRSVIVVHQVARPVPWTPGRDLWWHEALATLEA
ncbi:AMP-binding protein [Streptomyces chumphonensis]|uniref:AMP-binding protein n=1 Tax=Streptomyces chumphonensis TaxID=1214925 RepID=UPI003D7196EA